MKKRFALLLLFPLTAAFAWDGVEEKTGTPIEITSRLIKVKKGHTVEIFDHGKDEYHEVEIDRISSQGKDVKIEVYDKDTGKERVFIMEGGRKQAP